MPIVENFPYDYIFNVPAKMALLALGGMGIILLYGQIEVRLYSKISNVVRVIVLMNVIPYSILARGIINAIEQNSIMICFSAMIGLVFIEGILIELLRYLESKNKKK